MSSHMVEKNKASMAKPNDSRGDVHMTLYHFCAAHMVKSIQKSGLTRGVFPLLGARHVTLIDNCQWLTAEPDSAKQSWATSTIIPYSRTACRLTVEIPEGHTRKLYRAIDFIQELPERNKQLVTGWPGSDDWYVFKGIIPPRWITGITEMEGGGKC